jgi:hypothetical protein
MYRFVDRDMFMRYLWGLAVGHTYAHERMKRSVSHDEPEEEEDVQGVYNEQDSHTSAHERTAQDDEPGQEEDIREVYDEDDYQSECDSDYIYDSTESLSEGDSNHNY